MLAKSKKLSAFFSLTKPRLSSFVVLSAAAGYAMAPVPFAPVTCLAAMLGTSLTVGSANAGNQALEHRHDANMQRTRLRAIPRGLLSARQAALFSGTLGVAGGALLYTAVNPMAAALAVGNIALYVGVYTPMKRVHWSNTWVGAFVGAVPPLVGWAAATGGQLDQGAFALAAVLYAWQIPHFLSLSWTIRKQYTAAGYKMMSRQLAHKVSGVTLLWATYTLPLGLLCAYSGLTDYWFALTSLAPGIPLMVAAQKFARDRSNKNSRAVFKSTLAWLPIFLGLMFLHKKRKTAEQKQIEAKK